MHVNIALRYLRESKKHQAIARSVTTIGGFLGSAFFAALVLVAIEGPHELDLRVTAQAEWHRRAALRNESIQMLQSVLVNHSNALGNLSAISDELLQLAGSVPLVEEDHARWNWTLPGAIYFVFTVVTTIGYGNFTPQTAAGRTWTVVFGFFGIVYAACHETHKPRLPILLLTFLCHLAPSPHPTIGHVCCLRRAHLSHDESCHQRMLDPPPCVLASNSGDRVETIATATRCPGASNSLCLGRHTPCLLDDWRGSL